MRTGRGAGPARTVRRGLPPPTEVTTTDGEWRVMTGSEGEWNVIRSRSERSRGAAVSPARRPTGRRDEAGYLP